jgi:hypothetical protein
MKASSQIAATVSNRHIAARDRPFVVLLQHDSTDETPDPWLVGEYSDEIGALLDLLVETFKWICRQ